MKWKLDLLRAACFFAAAGVLYFISLNLAEGEDVDVLVANMRYMMVEVIEFADGVGRYIPNAFTDAPERTAQGLRDSLVDLNRYSEKAHGLTSGIKWFAWILIVMYLVMGLDVLLRLIISRNSSDKHPKLMNQSGSATKSQT